MGVLEQLEMRFLRSLCLVLGVAALVLASSGPAFSQVVGKATADFVNQRPGRGETAWGRLVADSVRQVAKGDIAVVNAGALRQGTLNEGPVEVADLDVLLAFGEDEVVTLTISGAQIRAALERAASAFPTSSPAYLHCSGLAASFDPAQGPGKRVGEIKIKNRVIGDQETFTAAMPMSLSEGAAGYFNIWSGAQAKRAGSTLRQSIGSFIQSKGEVAPEETVRFGPI